MRSRPVWVDQYFKRAPRHFLAGARRRPTDNRIILKQLNHGLTRRYHAINDRWRTSQSAITLLSRCQPEFCPDRFIRLRDRTPDQQRQPEYNRRDPVSVMYDLYPDHSTYTSVFTQITSTIRYDHFLHSTSWLRLI